MASALNNKAPRYMASKWAESLSGERPAPRGATRSPDTSRAPSVGPLQWASLIVPLCPLLSAPVVLRKQVDSSQHPHTCGNPGGSLPFLGICCWKEGRGCLSDLSSCHSRGPRNCWSLSCPLRVPGAVPPWKLFPSISAGPPPSPPVFAQRPLSQGDLPVRCLPHYLLPLLYFFQAPDPQTRPKFFTYPFHEAPLDPLLFSSRLYPQRLEPARSAAGG